MKMIGIFMPRTHLIGIIIFILLVVAIAIPGLKKIEDQTRKDAVSTLQTILQATKNSINLWAHDYEEDTKTIAKLPLLVELAKKQLALPPDRNSLLASPALAELRKLLKPKLEEYGDLGFFIISPNFISVASVRDSNVGSINIIARERQDTLKEVFQGSVRLIPPIFSEVALPNSTGKLVRGVPTMFVAAPIKDETGKVIAVFTKRIDPRGKFNEITLTGRTWKTVETYFFDREGRLLTESRFEDHLKTIGFLNSLKESFLTVKIKDPGGNLLEGFVPKKKHEEWPLTRMARSAVKGEFGTDSQGYRDYRGVLVLGAWEWNDELGFGMTTEIDLREALESYYLVSKITIGLLSFTVVLAVVFLALMSYFRRVGEEAVRENEKRLKSIMNNVLDGIVTANEQGIIESVNIGLSNIFDYNEQELVGQNIKRLIPEPSREKHDKSFANYLRTGNSKIIGKGFIELSALHKNGTIIPIELSISEIYIKCRRVFIGVIRDITERKKAGEKLRRMARGIESIGEAMVMTNVDGNIQYVNPAFENLTGYSANEVLEKNPRIWKSNRHSADFYVKMWKIIKSGKTFFAEITNKRKDGSLYDLELSITTVFDELNKIKGYVAVQHDLSDRKNKEEAIRAKEVAEQASKAKSAFLSNMSHELRTPLNAIVGFTDLLHQQKHYGELNEKQLSFVKRIDNSSKHLLDLINDLLDVAKIDAGSMQLKIDEVSSREYIEAIVSMMSSQFKKKQISIAISFDPGLTRILVDAKRYKQILLNLLSNALKYTPKNGRVAIKTGKNDSQVKTEVTDTGVGIEEKDINKIFSEFHQADSVRDEQLGGTGIGLALTRRLVELHGGEIGVKSRPGKGSTFWFTLPLKKMAEYKADKSLKKDKTVQEVPTGRKILVVEDNEVNLEMVLHMLAIHEHEVADAKNGQEAIEVAQSFKPELILMDIKMPVMNGIEATKLLKAMPEFADVPIIALSASTGGESSEKQIKAGCSEHLAKPIKSEDLFAVLQRHLK